jgi:luciferase family oxidoreductase group 1
MIPFSVLDLSPINQGSTATEALRNTRSLAQHVEKLGYHRFWLAEHHNMTGIASAATSVVIGYVADATSTIRVGSGGVMLPNHAPLVIAEQFGTLASLHPDRIDLGLGRAPGTDMLTARALRRDLQSSSDQFPQDVVELLSYFEDAAPGQQIRAVPGYGTHVPIWLLGSSLFSAQLAAMLGLPFSFASHFAPEHMVQALRLYRERFEPSKYLDKPYAMLAINAIAADTDAEALRLFTSQQQSFTLLRRGHPGQLPPPVDNIDDFWTPTERILSIQTLRYAQVGSAETIERGLREFIDAHQPNELMITGHIYDHAARLRSFEIVAELRDRIAASESAEFTPADAGITTWNEPQKA